jgi:hypothetical protein
MTGKIMSYYSGLHAAEIKGTPEDGQAYSNSNGQSVEDLPGFNSHIGGGDLKW